MDLDARWDFATALAREAGALAHRYFQNRDALTVEMKGPQDLVSQADREVETLIRRRVAESFPTDAVLGEEQGGATEGETAESLWVVDPIDGTTNFLRGLPNYGVSIAFVHRGVVELGVIFAPAFGELFAARRGRGASLNGTAIHTARTTAIDQALFGWGSSRRTPRDVDLGRLGSLLSKGAEYRRAGSAVINLCQVACGRLDAFYEAKLSSWDVLAGLLLVEEAGGVVNDFLAGGGLTQGNVTLAACTPEIYRAIAEVTSVA